MIDIKASVHQLSFINLIYEEETRTKTDHPEYWINDRF